MGGNFLGGNFPGRNYVMINMIVIISPNFLTTIISTNFLLCTFWENAQFPQSSGLVIRNTAETARFHKISTRGS